MAAPINISAYKDALVVLGTASIVVPIVRRSGLSPMLGYLAAGALLGLPGLGSFIGTVPFLYWVTVVDAKNVAGIAELGVVFLLFLIGMELSYKRLKAMRRLVFGLGSLQIVLSTIAIGGVAALIGNTPAVSIIIAASSHCRRPRSSWRSFPIKGASRRLRAAQVWPFSSRKTWRWFRSCSLSPLSASVRAAQS